MTRKLAASRGYWMSFARNVLVCTTLLAGTAVVFTQVRADDINWRQFEGASIVWAYDIHPYADAVAAQLPEFEKLTGIKVTPELYPDDAYWNKLTIQLSTKSPGWDVVGTGIQPAWDLAPGQLLEPLDSYLNDPKLTAAGYDYQDFFPALRDALTWKVKEGQIEPRSGQVWAIAHGFENIQLFYRKDILDKHGVEIPTAPPEMSAACEKLKAADPAITPLGVRGDRLARGGGRREIIRANSKCDRLATSRFRSKLVEVERPRPDRADDAPGGHKPICMDFRSNTQYQPLRDLAGA
ncbi:ABC transporter substrate-binding protein [Bradyrhizobium ottawaense]|uniref:ABC transporter substrate-binding protein n=1 Tax=Bradyrhizobium ottawaense TaxID=931866 RepID=UPI001FE20C80|nr:extracellular solute-binding protein [Bradyrhizobium ottawaense]